MDPLKNRLLPRFSTIRLQISRVLDDIRDKRCMQSDLRKTSMRLAIEFQSRTLKLHGIPHTPLVYVKTKDRIDAGNQRNSVLN